MKVHLDLEFMEAGIRGKVTLIHSKSIPLKLDLNLLALSVLTEEHTFVLGNSCLPTSPISPQIPHALVNYAPSALILISPT